MGSIVAGVFYCCCLQGIYYTACLGKKFYTKLLVPQMARRGSLWRWVGVGTKAWCSELGRDVDKGRLGKGEFMHPFSVKTSGLYGTTTIMPSEGKQTYNKGYTYIWQCGRSVGLGQNIKILKGQATDIQPGIVPLQLVLVMSVLSYRHGLSLMNLIRDSLSTASLLFPSLALVDMVYRGIQRHRLNWK